MNAIEKVIGKIGIHKDLGKVKVLGALDGSRTIAVIEVMQRKEGWNETTQKYEPIKKFVPNLDCQGNKIGMRFISYTNKESNDEFGKIDQTHIKKINFETDGLNIKKLALDFRKGILGDAISFNMCYLVSSSLSGYLSSLGIENELVTFDIDSNNSRFEIDSNVDVIEHYCLKIGNKILDATADQFKNMPKVFFGSRPIWYQDCKS